MSLKIPFNKPKLSGDELEYINRAVDSGHISGNGDFTKACETLINQEVGSAASLLTHSCTAALEMASILADLKPGDEVIVPSFTFVSTASAIVMQGATPVFVDVREDTFNLNEALIEEAITERTKAIYVVHYAGVVAEMDAILTIATKHNLIVVEDAAQALGSYYNGKSAGSFGDAATFSFHETKNIISGEGGCLTLNNRDFIDRAEIIREKGTNRKAFFAGMVDKYTWVDKGSSYLPSELVAAFLFAQLEKRVEINSARLSVWQKYYEAFSPLEHLGVKLPQVPSECQHNAHMFYLVLPDRAHRDAFISGMREADINTPFHYIPLHSSPAGLRFGRAHGSMIVTDWISDRLVRLPLYSGLSPSELEQVIGVGSKILNSILK